MHFLIDCYRVWKCQSLRGRRLGGMFAFLTLKLLRTLRKRSVKPRVFRWLGLKIHFEDYRQLDFLIREIFAKDTYFFRSDKADPVVIDAGSNLGMFTLYAKHHFPACRITAFEPDSQSFELLGRNVSDNALGEVGIHQTLLAGDERETEFYGARSGMGQLMNSAVAARAPTGTRTTLRSSTLSSFIEGPVDYLKLDIEGSEQGVLEELERSGRIRQIHQMGIEYHHNLGEPGHQQLASFIDLLERNGFTTQVAAEYTPVEDGEAFQDLMIYARRR